jgi:hypothetical protein
MINKLCTPQRLGDIADWGDSAGDDSGVDWTSVIQTGISTAGNVLSTTKTPYTTPVPTKIYTAAPTGAALSATGTFPTWLIIAGLGLGALVLMRK